MVGVPGAGGRGLGGPGRRDAAGVRDLAAHRTLAGGRVDRGGGGTGRSAPAEATVAARLAAVVSFYRFQHDVHGRGAALARASMRSVRRGRYRPMLAHLEGRRERRASPLRLRASAPGPPPVLTPVQVGAILEGCARFERERGEWRGSLRDRLLFATLAETGVRLGEALCLTHADWHVGRGETPFIEVVPREHPHGQRTKGGRPRRIYVSDALERLYSDYLWLLADLADAAGRVLEDDWFVFVNLAREPRFRAMRPESVYALFGACAAGSATRYRPSSPRTGFVTRTRPRCCWPGCPSTW